MASKGRKKDLNCKLKLWLNKIPCEMRLHWKFQESNIQNDDVIFDEKWALIVDRNTEPISNLSWRLGVIIFINMCTHFQHEMPKFPKHHHDEAATYCQYRINTMRIKLSWNHVTHLHLFHITPSDPIQSTCLCAPVTLEGLAHSCSCSRSPSASVNDN